MTMLIATVLEGVFAAISAVGFSLISDPPKKLIAVTALLASIGRGFRYFLINTYDMDIAFATFCASMAVGFIGIYLANKLRCPMEVISFTALLPMVPGMFAYKTVLSFVNFANSDILEEKQALIVAIFDNGTATFTIITALAVGVTIPLLIFYEKSFTMTRRKK